MMKKTTLVLQDEVNCRFMDLEPATRRKMVEALSFIPGYARHTPAFKMGRWDGKISFATHGGGSFINLLEKLIPIVVADGYEIVLDDRRVPFPVDLGEIDENYLSDFSWPAKHRLAGQPIVLTDYQVEAVNTFFKNTQSLQELPTSFGKTMTCAAMVRRVEETIDGARTLTIVPSKSLVGQTYDDYINIGRDAGKFFGDQKDWGKKHTIATWQSLSVFAKKDKQKRITIDESFAKFLEGVVCVINDECHNAAAVEMRKLLSDGKGASIPIRWGMTGTVPKEDYLKMAILSVIGECVAKVKAKELQDLGILATVKINIIQTDDSHMEFADYHAAHSYLVTDPNRLDWLADYVKGLSETGNVLILYDRIVTGEMLAERIDDLLVINGSVKLKKRKEGYDSFADDTNIICAATYGVASTGISIPAIHHLVTIELGKSFQKTIQSIGRSLRITNIKNSAEVHDFCSNNSYSKRHLQERKGFYKDASYPFTVTTIKI